MRLGEGACLICGEQLHYKEKAHEMKCSICQEKFASYVSCKDNHYVCDGCHAEKGIQYVMDYCLQSQSRNPIQMLQEMMEYPYIYMHGPEHHIMVGAALITAYHNSGGEVKLKEALEEMKARGSQYPGGTCGFWGACGAGASTGMYLSIITGATPLSVKPWRWANEMTSRALGKIAELGGPRCCKRNSFTAVKEAVNFTEEKLGIVMELSEDIQCDFFKENRECRKKSCPYYGHS